jgi:hypothetical protein
MSKDALADHSLEWYRLAAKVRENAAEMPYLLDMAGELERLLASSSRIAAERATLDAQRHQLSRDLDAVKSRARIVAAQLRAGVKAKLGFGSEKLTEFGMRPRRRDVRRREEESKGAALGATAPAGSQNDS